MTSVPSTGRRLSRRARLDAGEVAATTPVAEQDAVWSRNSNDKVDIGQILTGVLSDLFRARSPRPRLRGLSVGSSTEPQFRILQPTCVGGLHLLDIDPLALSHIRERTRRQNIGNVSTIEADFTDVLADRAGAERFRRDALNGSRMGLVMFHHSLYYAPRPAWDDLVDAVWHGVLSPGPVALHAVLMAQRSDVPTSTTALYDRWAGQFFGAHNEQDLAGFGRTLRRTDALTGATVRGHRSEVVFDTDDFTDLMRCVWMILLHPQVHDYDPDQRAEITEWVYANLWTLGIPLVQHQDHLVITR